jgi:hypothetical protein
MRPFLRCIRVLALASAVLFTSACASTPDRGSALQEAQYAWSAAIRWGDFEGAWTLVDPAYRQAHPLGTVELERYKQVQVSSYHETGTRIEGDTATREIQIGVVNRNTLVQRDERYVEQWRYDAQQERWWITGGLPDFWQD